MGAILNPEVSDFHKIIGPRYVDKTELIAYTNSVMETDLKLICFSRPRRFGKSYAAKMLAAFYSKGADWRAAFEKLNIAQNDRFSKCQSFKITKLDWKALRLGGHVHAVPPQNTSRTCPICGCVSKDNRKTQAWFKCVSSGHQGNADVVAAINIKERGRSSLACGESEKNAQAQVNSGRSKKPAPIQQQESTEVINSASC